MKTNYTEKEVLKFCEEVWPGCEIEVQKHKKQNCKYSITVKRMYEYANLSFPILVKLTKFFETIDINESRYSYPGCDTCDYGSSYELELKIYDDSHLEENFKTMYGEK